MVSLASDLRYGARMLIKHPGFTAIAVITMALGIGANTAIFSVVNALLLRPPALPHPERLVTVWGTTPTIPREEASLPDFADWRGESTSFESMSAAALSSVNITGNGDPERVIGARVTSDFLTTLGVPPVMGRNFTTEEDRPNSARVAILTNGLWQRRFGGDPAAVGKLVELNGSTYTVVGVMPASFNMPGLTRPDVFVPLTMDPKDSGRRSDFLFVIGRLRPDVPLSRAETEMQAIASRLEAEYPATNTNWTVKLIPLHELMVEKMRPALLLLLGAVGLVLLIACANVANLLLARSAARQHEIAIRAALGAGRWRIARQVLTESMLLSALGGVAGLVVAPWAIDLLLLAVPANVAAMADTSPDLWVIAFALAVSLATGLLFGLAPALQISKIGAGEALKDGGRGSAGDARRRLRGALVAAQVGLALVLLVGVGLMLRSLQKLESVDLGFDPSGLMTARVTLPKSPYEEDAKIRQFYDRLGERIAAEPGVQSVGFANALPILGGGPYLTFVEDGAPPAANGNEPDANVRIVDAGYFETMRMSMRSGRGLLPSDRDGTPNALVINEAMARRYWPGQDPIGKRIAFDGTDSGPNFREIVGVVGDVHHEGVDADEVPAAYIPYRQRASMSMAVVVRTDGDPTALTDAIRGAIHDVDPNLPVYAVRTMDAALGESLAPRRYAMLLLGAFGVMALLLAAIGIYGVMSYLVTQRTQEIGIRMALGAERRNVLALVLRQGLAMAAAGLAAGGVASFGFAWLISSQLFETSAADPYAFVGAGVVLVAAAVLASYVPARRATKVDPMVALRYE